MKQFTLSIPAIVRELMKHAQEGMLFAGLAVSGLPDSIEYALGEDGEPSVISTFTYGSFSIYAEADMDTRPVQGEFLRLKILEVHDGCREVIRLGADGCNMIECKLIELALNDDADLPSSMVDIEEEAREYLAKRLLVQQPVDRLLN